MTYSMFQRHVPETVLIHLTRFLQEAAYWNKEADARLARGESVQQFSALVMKQYAEDSFFRHVERLVRHVPDTNPLDHSARKLVRKQK